MKSFLKTFYFLGSPLLLFFFFNNTNFLDAHGQLRAPDLHPRKSLRDLRNQKSIEKPISSDVEESNESATETSNGHKGVLE